MPPTAHRQPCPVCPRWVTVDGDGLIANHWPPGTVTGPVCPGSGHAPTLARPVTTVVPGAREDPVARAFVARREVLGMLQRDVAKMMGCSPARYGAIERGDFSPTLRTVRQVCAALHLQVQVSPVGDVNQEADRLALNLIAGGNQAAAAAQAEAEELRHRLDHARAELARAQAVARRAVAALDALARQPELTHDLIDQARAVVTGRHERRAA